MQNVVQESYWEAANSENFVELAIDLYNKQYAQNKVYQKFVDKLYGQGYQPESLNTIPFLPIEFFKNHIIQTGTFEPERIFLSSGTTTSKASERSKRVLKSIGEYRKVALKGFELALGAPKNFCILGLLPSYLERNDASLVQMVQFLIEESGVDLSGFYLNQYDELLQTIELLKSAGTPTAIFGVTFALLDLLEKGSVPLDENFTILETGGMKGRRKEMVKDELYERLRSGFMLKRIGSEYGMTELLSQAYSSDSGKYVCPPWMRVLIRENTNPLELGLVEKRGGINIIDLASEDTCAFIQSSDLGRLNDDATFEVLGRLDNTDIRGCSQMI